MLWQKSVPKAMCLLEHHEQARRTSDRKGCECMRMAVRSRHTTVSECNRIAGYGEEDLLKPTKTKSFARHVIILQHPHGHGYK